MRPTLTSALSVDPSVPWACNCHTTTRPTKSSSVQVSTVRGSVLRYLRWDIYAQYKFMVSTIRAASGSRVDLLPPVQKQRHTVRLPTCRPVEVLTQSVHTWRLIHSNTQVLCFGAHTQEPQRYKYHVVERRSIHVEFQYSSAHKYT